MNKVPKQDILFISRKLFINCILGTIWVPIMYFAFAFMSFPLSSLRKPVSEKISVRAK